MTHVKFVSKGVVFLDSKIVTETDLDESARMRLCYLGNAPFCAPFFLGSDDPRFEFRFESENSVVVKVLEEASPAAFFAQEKSDEAMLTLYKTGNTLHILTENSNEFIDETPPYPIENIKCAAESGLFFVRGKSGEKDFLYISSGQSARTLLLLCADTIELTESGIEAQEAVKGMAVKNRLSLYRFNGESYERAWVRFERRQNACPAALLPHLFLESLLLFDDETLSSLLSEPLRPELDRLKEYLGPFELLESETFVENAPAVYYRKGNRLYPGRIEFEMKNGLIENIRKS